MKKGYTDITVALDRSGSMEIIKDDTIGGFNQFLSDQKAVPGDATITLAQFDDQYEVVYSASDIQSVKALDSLTFVPRGSTALYDAIGRTIIDTGKRLEAMPEDARPGKVIFVIVTDGQENASKEFRVDKISEMIGHQKTKYSWEFVFLGANQDAIFTAKNIGISAANAMTYAANSKGVHAVYATISSNMTAFRCGTVSSMAFTDADRQTQAAL